MNAADDTRALADILEAVDDAGGDVRDVDIDFRSTLSVNGPDTTGPLFTFGRSSKTVVTIEVAVDGSSQDPTDRDAESIEIDDSHGDGDVLVDPLESIPGVGELKAATLRGAGFETIEDIRAADQSELADVDQIGNALASRIKADVDGPEEAGDEDVSESIPIDDSVETDDGGDEP